MLSPMKKRTSREQKYFLPKLPSLNHSTLGTTSPSNSFSQNASHSYYKHDPADRPRVPRLICKPAQQVKPKNQNPIDAEFFDEYKKWELKRSLKIPDEKYPFWYLRTLRIDDFSSVKDEKSFTEEHCLKSDGFLKWCQEMTERSGL